MKAQSIGCAGWGEILHEWTQDAHTRQLGADHIARIPRMINRLRQAVAVDNLADIDRSIMRGYLADLSQTGAKGKPLTPKTMRNTIAGFSAFFDWCKQAEMAPASWSNPCDGIRLPRLQDNPRRAFTQDEVIAVFEAAKLDELSDQHAATSADGLPKMRSGLYWLLACTGLRIGMAERLRVRHLSLGGSAPCVYVPATGTGKERKARTVQISAFDAGILLDFLSRHPRHPGPDDLPFERPHPRILYGDCEAGGVELQDQSGRWLGFHSFRRFHATQLLKMKIDPKLVQKRLGHARLDTTVKHYRDIDLEEHAEVARELGDSFSAKMPVIPLTPRGDITDTVNSSQSHPLESTDGCENDDPRLAATKSGCLSHPSDLPRSTQAGQDSRDAEKWRTGDSNPRPPNDSILGQGPIEEAIVLLARILDRLTDRR